MKKKLRIFLLSIFSILLTISCEIGLGSSVDTESPTLEIKNPPADAVIRDEFAITGNWTDDGTISSVKVDMVRLDNSESFPFKGTFLLNSAQRGDHKKGTWSVVVNPFEAELIDGKYEALVAITDDAGHVTTMARSFSIDNTPPLMLLSRPSITYEQAGFDNYGRSFTLEGKAADDSGVGLIQVNVFDLNDTTGVPLKTVELTNLPHTIEQDVAVFASDNEIMKANYAAIYGHTDADGNIMPEEMDITEQRYCTLMIYDDAARYPSDGSEQTAEDKRGNSTDVYYMDSEISTQFQGKYKITDLYNIQNGTYEIKNERSAAVIEEISNVKDILKNIEVTKSKFSINPSNNPKFVVTAANVKDATKTLNDIDYQFTVGNRYLEVEVSPGLDGYPIEPDSVGVYLQECDVNGNIIEGSEKICLIDKGADKHIVLDSDEPITTDDNTVGGLKISGKIYKFKTSKVVDNKNYGVLIGHYYAVIVEGNDSQGASDGYLISEGLYAFKMVSSKEKLELSASGMPEYISKNESAWSVGEKYQNNKYKVTLSWQSGEAPYYLYRGEQLIGEALEVLTAEDTLSYSELKALGTDGHFPEKLTYQLKNSAGEVISTTATVNLNYDSTIPSISNIQFANAYEKIVKNATGEDESTYYLNNKKGKKYSISGIATDDTGIESIKLEIPGLSFDELYEGRFNFSNISFDSLTAASVTAKVIVTDVAGNQQIKELPIVFDNTAPFGVHEKDAKGKDLTFRIGDFDNDDIDETHELWTANPAANKDVGKKYAKNSYGNENTIQLRGNISDNDGGSGVAMIYYKVFVDNPPTTEDVNNFVQNYKTDKDRTGYFAPLSENETKLIFYNVKKENAENSQYNFSGTKFNDTLETWTDTETDTEYQLYKFYKSIITTFKSKLSNFEEGNNYVLLIAEDNAGNVGADSEYYSINVDTAVPDITPGTTDIYYTNGTVPLTISGTITDTCGKDDVPGAGVDTKNLKFRVGNQEELVPVKTIVPANDVNDLNKLNWTVEIPKERFAGLSDGNVTVYAIALDKAGTGNKTTTNIATVSIDTSAPKVFITPPSDADTSTEDIIEVNGSIGLSGTVEEANRLSAEKLKIYYTTSNSLGDKEGSEITEEDIMKTGASAGENDVISKKFKYIKEVNNSYNWNFENIITSKLDGENAIADGTTIYFTVSSRDLAGNIGFAKPQKIIVDQDTDRPVIHLSNLSLTYKDKTTNEIKKMSSSDYVWLNSSVISGTVNDDDGAIKSVKIIAKDSTVTNEPSDTEWAAESNRYKNGIWTCPVDNGSKKIFFQIEDKNGTKFISNTASISSGSYGPKIEDVNSVRFGYTDAGNTTDDIIYVKVDTDDPKLTYLYYFTSAELITNPETEITGWTEATSSVISDKFGGVKKYLYIKYKAFDTNGISSITPTFAGLNVIADKTVEITQTDEYEQYKEFISCFDISSVESGLKTLTLTIKDNASEDTASDGIPKPYEVMIDNTDPEISFSNYTSGSQVYGSSAVTLRGTTSDTNKVSKVEFAITKEDDFDSISEWTDITDESNITYTSKLVWQIVFDDKTAIADNTSYHSELLRKKLFALYGIASADQASYDEIKEIYIWLRATDEFGNCGLSPHPFYFNVIPNGDRPAVEITYPSDNTSVGGTIRITGTTDIQDVSASVSEVYIQIDPSYDAAAGFNPDWATELQTLMTAKGVTSYSIIDNPTATVAGSTQSFADKIGKGIQSQGNSKLNWFLKINENKEFNSKVDNSNRKIAIRAYAISSTGKISVSDVCKCEIDPDAPIFGGTDSLRFVQYTDSTMTVESASRKFESGVYLKGQWYLVGSVEDDSGIRQITLGDTNIVWTHGSGDNEVVMTDGTNRAIENEIPSSVAKFKNYNLRIPVGNTTANSFGKIDYEISATDGSDSQTGNELKFTIFYDNKVPDFEVKRGNGIDLVENGKIYQSNGAYTVQGTFAEPSEDSNNQSGFKRIAMYFTRERTVSGVKGLYILDSMLDSGTEGTSNFIKLGSLDSNGTITYESNIEKREGLYWRKVNGTLENTNELTIADTSIITNYTIRKGGICMVDNVIYRISDIIGTKITLEGSLSDFTTQKPVYFAYAQIIDNHSQENGKTVIYTDNDVITNGDDDCMIEGVQFSNGEYSWNVSVDSSNMLDGNVTMSFVAFDAAGNSIEKSIKQKISNNAPRIAGVSVGTDTNLNGIVDDGEIITSYSSIFTNVVNVRDGNTYNGRNDEGEIITSYEIPLTLNVKGALKVIPMIVGGNTALGWQYIYKNKSNVMASTTTVAYDGVGHSNDGSVREDDLTIDILLKDFLEKQVKEGSQNLKFTIWDKTDGSTLGDESTGSAKAEIIVPVNIIIEDSVDPIAVVYPFFWKSKNENSIYQNNPKNGHIELENELPVSFTTEGSGTGDRDAKVSGMITFDGVASDNVIVEKIKIAIPGYNSGNEFVIAQRDASATATDGWTSTHLYYKKSNEVKAGASLTGNTASDWVFELVSDTYDADGKNIITFRFHFNTEKISTKTLSNASIKFTAMDKGSPALNDSEVGYSNERSSTPGNNSTTAATPTGCYKVDVVPYITRVETALSSLKKNNPSVFARTAKGHYGVSSNEILNVEGFNITGGTLKFTKGSESVSAEYNSAAGQNSNGEDIAGYVIPETATSGNMSIVVNEIESLNNSNNNDAKGTYAETVNLTTNPTGIESVYSNYYNRQPNGDNNNLLTDDVSIEIWEFDPQAVKPKVGSIEHPVMAINPALKNIGFAFVGGTAYFSMPYGTNSKSVTPNSFEYWIGGLDAWNSVSLAYDINGYSYSTAAGGDLNTSKHGVDIFRFTTSRWNGKGTLSTEGYKDLNNQFGLEYIGEREYFIDENNTWTDFTNFSKERIKSPSLSTVASKSDSSKATVYLAYYDAINDEVRFNWGIIKNSKNESDDTGMFGDHYGTGRQSQKYSIGGTSLIAGQTINKAISTTPTYASSPVTTETGEAIYGGEYVSIAAIPNGGSSDDAVVAVWWDGTHHKMLYSYNKKPKSIQAGEYLQSDTEWSKPESLFPQEIGEYCKVSVDGLGGVHIAAYDSTNGDIWYAYLQNFDSPSTAKAGCLDSNGFVGSELNIDVALVDGKPIPYVSYYASNAAKPKIACWIGDSLAQISSVSGSDNDLYTLNWEIGYVPTSSKLLHDHINIGVWKNDNGVLEASVEGEKQFSSAAGSSSNSYGTVWGNGTSNPVLGYATKSGSIGFIETAQMR